MKPAHCGAGFQPASSSAISPSLAIQETARLQPASQTPQEIATNTEPPLTLGKCVLRQPENARIVQDSILFFEAKRYYLSAWSIMPNHVHVVVTPIDSHSLSDVLHSWKSYTSSQINKRLAQLGTLWERESFDHAIRSVEEWEYFICYTEENPAAAGICAADSYPFSSREIRFKTFASTGRPDRSRKGRTCHIAGTRRIAAFCTGGWRNAIFCNISSLRCCCSK